MSYEIRPAEVMSGLREANQRVADIVDRADAIVPAVSAISSSPVLQGRGYDALGSSLRGEYTALASVFRIAGSNFTAANNKHLAALEYISQYVYLNMDQIWEEIDEIRENIREIDRQITQIIVDHTLGLRNGTTSGRPDTSGLVNIRGVWESRLETVEKKRDDFEAYLAASSGLYDGTLDLLRCRVERMDVATLCPATGGLRVPSVKEFEAMRILEELVVRDDDGNIIGFNWDLIEAFGQHPYAEWAVVEFMVLALLIDVINRELDLKALNQIFWDCEDFFVDFWWQDPFRLAIAMELLFYEVDSKGGMDLNELLWLHDDIMEDNFRLQTLQALLGVPIEAMKFWDGSSQMRLENFLKSENIQFDYTNIRLDIKILQSLVYRNKNCEVWQLNHKLEQIMPFIVTGCVGGLGVARALANMRITSIRGIGGPRPSTDFFVGPNGMVLPARFKGWIGVSRRPELLARVENPLLRNAINQLYRPGSFIGDGGTAAVIRFEKATGIGLGRNGGTHIQKGRDMVRYLENRVSKQNLSPSDRRLLDELLRDLNDALGR